MFDYDYICGQIICNCNKKEIREDIYVSKIIIKQCSQFLQSQ